MIYDIINNIEVYKGLYKNLDITIDYILSHDLRELALGKTYICGDDIYVNIVESDLKAESDGVYEIHKKYLDLHIDIEGTEQILWCDYLIDNVLHSYDIDSDYELLNGNAISNCLIDNNHFVICMLEESHMPCVLNKNCNKVKKAIFKIKVKD